MQTVTTWFSSVVMQSRWGDRKHFESAATISISPINSDGEGQAASHNSALRWMADLKVHHPRGIPAMIDGYPQQLNFRASKCHSRMECHLIKVLFNIYQTCGWAGVEGLWSHSLGKYEQMLQLLKWENHENTIWYYSNVCPLTLK